MRMFKVKLEGLPIGVRWSVVKLAGELGEFDQHTGILQIPDTVWWMIEKKNTHYAIRWAQLQNFTSVKEVPMNGELF
jgi:hypothetical protein